jgi:hypothetical protein
MMWLFIIPAAVFLAVKVMRHLTALREKSVSEDESELPNIDVQSLQSKIMALALTNGGVLTVTDVVIAIGLSMKQAEETLNSMVDGYRVKMEVKDSGIIVYEFTELINKIES